MHYFILTWTSSIETDESVGVSIVTDASCIELMLQREKDS